MDFTKQIPWILPYTLLEHVQNSMVPVDSNVHVSQISTDRFEDSPSKDFHGDRIALGRRRPGGAPRWYKVGPPSYSVMFVG